MTTTITGEAPVQVPGYSIRQLLGTGGMAQVYLAIQQGFERPVALKVILPELATNAEFGKRFLREARIVGGLSHPHIISVHDVGEYQGTYYLAMELLTAGDLRERMRKPIGERSALIITQQIAAALGVAHRKGFIHRDIKPDNILFRESGEAVVTDFGIARPALADSEFTDITLVEAVIGSPRYMSPEQSMGQPLDGRSDIYSLGVLLYQMLVGEVPFSGGTLAEISLQRMQKQVPRLPDTQRYLQPLMDGMLAYEKDNRFASCDELGAALDNALAQVPAGSTKAYASTGQTTLVGPEAAPDASGSGSRFRNVLLFLAFGLVIGLVWVFGFRSTGALLPAGAEVVGNPTLPPDTASPEVTDARAVERTTGNTNADTPSPEEFFAFYDAVNSGFSEAERAFTQTYPASVFTDILKVKLNRDQALFDAIVRDADRGNTGARIVASELFDTGWGGKQNQGRALEYAQEAMASGNAFAEYHYAMLRLTSGTTDEQRRDGLQALRRSAGQGFFLAQTVLASYLLEGQVLGRDVAAGLQLLQAAGEQGDRNALFNLAQILDAGLYGQKAAPDRAKRLFQQAAALGHPGAMSYLKEP